MRAQSHKNCAERIPVAPYTPLRYPGGKAKLANFIKRVFEANALNGGSYIEAYAGGAGIAFDLLFSGYVKKVYLNDLDPAVHAFWKAVLSGTEDFARKITDTPLSVAQWKKQRLIYKQGFQAGHLDLGFAFFYLNRTNRSGVLNGGVIGGLDQTGEWKIDARFNREGLLRRIETIAEYKTKIILSNLDAKEFMTTVLPKVSERSLVYFDPPYYAKGQRLYKNYYKEKDHKDVAALIQEVKQFWIVTYDNVPDIHKLYNARRKAFFSLQYSAAKPRVGTEVMFFSDNLQIPAACDPLNCLTVDGRPSTHTEKPGLIGLGVVQQRG
jgi:DNA adenine methylase